MQCLVVNSEDNRGYGNDSDSVDSGGLFYIFFINALK